MGGVTTLPSKHDLQAETTGGPTISLPSRDREIPLPATPAPPPADQHYDQLFGRYILSAQPGGLQLIDQHRAHVAVLYQRFLERLSSRQGTSQSVLFPETIELAPSDQPILESILPELQHLGFDLDSLGGSTYAVNGLPAEVNGGDTQELLRQMVDTARQHEGGVRDELDRALALKMAEAEAVRYGHTMSLEEMRHLVSQLLELPMPGYTPDGKTIITLLSQDELAAKFS
jgi:DNA mismatch repair protein MutL